MSRQYSDSSGRHRPEVVHRSTPFIRSLSSTVIAASLIAAVAILLLIGTLLMTHESHGAATHIAQMGLAFLVITGMLIMLTGLLLRQRAEGAKLAAQGAALSLANHALLNEIVQRKAAEQERDRMVSVVEASPDSIGIADPEGNIIYINRGSRVMLGLDESAPDGLRVADMHPPWALEIIQNQGIPTALREGSWLGESTVRTQDGREIPVSQVIMAHRNDHGELLYFSTVKRDITERKQAIAELEQSRRELETLTESLEARVLERTTELLHARDEAERANAAKSEFLSRMSHELRTPLNAILGFAQLLESDPDHPLAETQADNVHEILHGGKHLLALINEVLDLARIESGRLEVSLEAVALRPLIETCMAQIKPLAAERGIDITVDISGAPTVQADYTRLRQVLLNLLSNAVKYNREAGRILIRGTTIDDQRLRIEVEDTGNGIPAESLSRLFRPFERLESAYLGIEGSGMGLALAKKLVEAMHGTIGVHSVSGTGSTFWFELPPGTTRRPVDTPLHAALAAPIQPGGARKLLYVEDNPASLKLAQKMLAKREDLELLVAGNGEAGITLAERDGPDLILLDINLPGIDGFRVLRQLKDNPATRDIPVVAVTANAMPRDIERGRVAGFADYLTKPLDVVILLEVIDRNLDRDPSYRRAGSES